MKSFWLFHTITFAMFSYSIGISCIEKSQNPSVTIDDGEVVGKSSKTIEGKNTFYAFRGIPYAKPPVGNLRFEPPVTNDKYNCSLDATKEPNACVQGSNPVIGSEDCLYLNVYTPTLERKGLAVMVWIFGGGFNTGNSSYQLYGPDYLLDQDIVFVSINHRLGIFGFLSTGDVAAYGNAGCKDQVAALKWVQKNIEKFGGDPLKVTLFGQSSGAISSSYMLLSPLTKGLFSGVIQQSGSSLTLSGFSRNPRPFAFNIGILLGISTTNSSILIQHLKDLDYMTLQTRVNDLASIVLLENPLVGIVTAPTLEPEHSGAFLTERMHEQFKNGKFEKVPVMVGFNSNESLALEAFLPKYISILGAVAPSKLSPADLTNDTGKRAAAGLEIQKKYFSDNSSVYKFISENQFERPTREQVIQTSKYSDVYFYRFSYQGLLPNVSRLSPGVGHEEELSYLFRRDRDYYIPELDKVVRSRLVKLWTNFAKTGNPTPEADTILENITWAKASPSRDNLIFLDINRNLELQNNPSHENMTFYDSIYEDYGDPPYDTF